MAHTDLFAAVDTLIEQMLGTGSLAASPAPVLRPTELPWTGDQPQFAIPEFGDVQVTWRAGPLSMQDGGEAFDPYARNRSWELGFQMGGALIARVYCTVYELDMGFESLFTSSPRMQAWASRFMTEDGGVRPLCHHVWPYYADEPYIDQFCWVKSVYVAPAFQSTELLGHMFETLRWLLGPGACSEPWCITVSAPTPEQVEASDERWWDSESSLSLDWCRAALQALGAVHAGPVNHSFGSAIAPKYCTRHPDLFLYPEPPIDR